MKKKPLPKKKSNGFDPSTQHAVEQFLYRQAELLDGKRWQDYIGLFSDDGVYWMPAKPEDKTWDGVPSIFAEDRNLMNVRMKRGLADSSPSFLRSEQMCTSTERSYTS